MDEDDVEVCKRASRGCSNTHRIHKRMIILTKATRDGHVGNIEAVKKYREKNKARTAYPEDEVKRLQSLNEHLLRKLQNQVIVETEIIRLRSLLVEMQRED